MKQYVRFCRIADEKRKLYMDDPEKAIEEILKQCREEGIRALVLTLKDIALAPAAIAQALVKQFDLPQDVAEQKVQQYGP